ncbi:hypothetical protein [Georgenia sp. H159]|uniref:hypothetical protein n=1 Tax=Georgenia sp. H159 TaxID=3076115 RepID=UPI002D7772E1|nr:hypothetical protein [Georgenia sp. H159]
MRVAVIGLGDIATMAYLPVLAATPGVTPVLVSRRRSTVEPVGSGTGSPSASPRWTRPSPRGWMRLPASSPSRTSSASLAVGFNRRYVPAYRTLAHWPDRDVVTLDGRRRQVVDLADVVDLVGEERAVRRDGWRPATELRGFTAMCGEFLAAVTDGRRLDAGDALVTYAVCERIVEAIGQAERPGAPVPA